MSIRGALVAFVAAALFTGCARSGTDARRDKAASTSSADTGSALVRAESGPRNDWTLVPGVRAGPIRAQDTFYDLQRLFGADHVQLHEVSLGEGETVAGAIVFADDPTRRLQVAFVDSDPKRGVDFVEVSGDSSLWKLQGSNVTVGSTLADLERLNGRPLQLAGFEWDYAGTIYSWEGGALAGPMEGVVLRTEKSAEGDAALKVMGDGQFSSSDPAMVAVKPKVRTVIVSLRQPAK